MPQPAGQEKRIDTLRRMVRECRNMRCLEWPFGKSSTGYGAVYELGQNLKAHRIAFETIFWPISRDLVIRHRCDNPSCVNPFHLLPGTAADNVQDKVMRGRAARGERHGRAKLSAADVLVIRGSELSSQQLAGQFGVSANMVRYIRKGANWSHLEAV